MMLKFLPIGAFLVLMRCTPFVDSMMPRGVASFNNSAVSGNVTFTPTNGFGTYVFGQLLNVTCNNQLPDLLPQIPFVGNNSLPCQVAVTLNNLANNVQPRQFTPSWDQIFDSLQPPPTTNNNPNQCGGIGPIVNPNKTMTISGFLGNFLVINGTVSFAGGPFNLSTIPTDLQAKPVVVWRNGIGDTAQLLKNSIPLPSQLLACAPIRLT